MSWVNARSASRRRKVSRLAAVVARIAPIAAFAAKISDPWENGFPRRRRVGGTADACRSAIVALCIAAILHTGCAHFIVRPNDGPAAKAAKVLTRTTFGVATLGGTEVYVYAAEKNEEIAATADPQRRTALEEQKKNAIVAYWVAIGIVIVIAAIVAVALSDDGGGGGGVYVPAAVIRTPSGTCSWHGGVSACLDGVAVCADGQMSPGYQPCYYE